MNKLTYDILGVRWQTIAFYDINSMYPCTFKEKFPTGLGFEWSHTGEGNYLKKTLMTDKKISLASIQWLDYVQNTSDLVVDRTGRRCRIFSGWNSNERKIGPYYVDGYCEVDDKIYVFEFDGCYYHACEVCEHCDDPERKRHAQRRERYLKMNGFTVIHMRECEWILKFNAIKDTYKPSISPLLFVNEIHHHYLWEKSVTINFMDLVLLTSNQHQLLKNFWTLIGRQY